MLALVFGSLILAQVNAEMVFENYQRAVATFS